MYMNEKLISDIKQIQNDYYSTSKKTFFNKKQLKTGCAELITQNISLAELISRTVSILQDTNKIIIDYTIFKTYSSSSNYGKIIESLISKIISVIGTFGTFEIHLNLDSLTITGLDKHQSVFQLYYDTCCTMGLSYNNNHIDKIVIYNTPMIIHTLIPIIVKYTDPSIKTKIQCVKK